MRATGLLVAIAILAWALNRLRVYPAVAAGYRAKVVCTAIFGSGRQFDERLKTQVSADAYWILRPFRVEIDRGARSVTASLFGMLPRTAIHREGLGATLVVDRPLVGSGIVPRVSGAGARQASDALEVSEVPAVPAPLEGSEAPQVPAPSQVARVWPRGKGSAHIDRVVSAAFDEPNPKRLRRTYAVVVVQDGEVVAERYANGITAEMPLPGWSMAKSVLNALVGILVTEGRLALDRAELLPQWRSPDPRAAITIEDLLRMRSGLRFSEVYANPWSDVLHMLYNAHDAAAYAASRPLAAAPGRQWQYSSGTSNILSSIARRTVGDAAYHGWPRRVLFERLGMTSAVLEPDASGTFVCSSYMLATARDWARFGQLFLDEGRFEEREILPESWVRFSTTPTPESPEGRFGAHWWLKLNPEIGGDAPAAARIPGDAFFAIGHEGQTLSVVPSKRLVVVRLGASIYIDAWDQASFLADLCS